MMVFRLIASLILKAISLPFMIIGLFGLCIYVVSNIFYKFSDNYLYTKK